MLLLGVRGVMGVIGDSGVKGDHGVRGERCNAAAPATCCCCCCGFMSRVRLLCEGGIRIEGGRAREDLVTGVTVMTGCC